MVNFSHMTPLNTVILFVFSNMLLLVNRDFFSRFCFYVRDVSKDAGHLESELRRMDCYLRNASSNNVFLCGPVPSFLDCEVLPKLHQVRVAAAGIKGLCYKNGFYSKIVIEEHRLSRIIAKIMDSQSVILAV
jgi:hypothetical protein